MRVRILHPEYVVCLFEKDISHVRVVGPVQVKHWALRKDPQLEISNDSEVVGTTTQSEVEVWMLVLVHRNHCGIWQYDLYIVRI